MYPYLDSLDGSHGLPDFHLPAGRPYTPELCGLHPVLSAPLLVPSAGTVYFARRVPEDLYALFRVLGILGDTKKYAAFAIHAREPGVECYLVQLRLVTFAALHTVYRLQSHPMPAAQTLPLAEAMVGFVESQAEHWLEPGRIFSSRLRGTAGGDGDQAKEDLAFGLHVEMAFWGVYRIWSRRWLVTK